MKVFQTQLNGPMFSFALTIYAISVYLLENNLVAV